MIVGTAVGSNDIHLIKPLRSLYDSGHIRYVELYILPDVELRELIKWNDSGIPFTTIQAAHGPKADIVSEYVETALDVCTHFFTNTSWTVFDAGIDRDFDIWKWSKNRAIPETMPFITSLSDPTVLALPEEVKGAFCLDFSHAWMTANILRKEPKEFIREFMSKNPVHFHVTDCRGTKEDHLPIGFGEIDFKFIHSILKEDSTVTIETEAEGYNRMDRITSDIFKFKEYGKDSSDNSG